MLLKNASILYGKDLQYIENTDIRISGQVLKKIKQNLASSKGEEKLDCQELVIIPGFVNAHTHIGDSIAKDVSLESTAEARIHPIHGIKSKILKNTKPSHLATFMKNSCLSMIKNGITTFVDFREGGLEGVLLLKKTISTLPIRSIILGRVEYYQKQKEITQNIPFTKSKQKELNAILQQCDGIGVSGANEYSDSVLKYYSGTKKIRAIHSSETKQSCTLSKKITKKSETQRCLLLKPHFLIHMTHASKKDLFLAARKTGGIVVCPRANAALAEGIPDIELMIKTGNTIAIGTDNVMINSPDMFREMDYLWKVSMAIHKKRIDAKQILKMATSNAGNILHKKIGSIKEEYLADCIFLDKHAVDLEPMHNSYASIVHRASESAIKAVMIGGKIVHGKL
ncbi:MAG: amidohydrolase family protein [Thaumarchaeota archaeon]|nr:amidohydrolase family protein [Nitrososphaerota archaeon]